MGTPDDTAEWTKAKVFAPYHGRGRFVHRTGHVHAAAPGLVIYRDYSGRFVVAHRGSGAPLITADTLVQARRRLLLLAPLADWTTPASELLTDALRQAARAILDGAAR